MKYQSKKNDYKLGWDAINNWTTTTDPIIDPQFARVFAKHSNWQCIGYRCNVCNKHFSKTQSIVKHRNLCTNTMINTLEENDMPIRKTEKGYYWGSKGPFPTREQAERVAQAAYSSGYKKPEDKKDKK